MSVDSSLCTRGIRVDAIAIRSSSMLTSPPTMSPRRRRPSSDPAMAASAVEHWNVRKAPVATFHPASTSARSSSAPSAGS
ncbi:MAG: hypothetical protein DMD81_18770 [Candidatus Rokuibacteriota bacterium]|nr:MAG: hypothetical protein DMD81_18770 [Candidatus Rokubacteria bacterium]